jgi:hypothetical protein
MVRVFRECLDRRTAEDLASQVLPCLLAVVGWSDAITVDCLHKCWFNPPCDESRREGQQRHWSNLWRRNGAFIERLLALVEAHVPGNDMELEMHAFQPMLAEQYRLPTPVTHALPFFWASFGRY